MADTITIASPADFHVHLRQGDMAKLVVPHVRMGGMNLGYVMVSPSTFKIAMHICNYFLHNLGTLKRRCRDGS